MAKQKLKVYFYWSQTSMMQANGGELALRSYEQDDYNQMSKRVLPIMDSRYFTLESRLFFLKDS